MARAGWEGEEGCRAGVDQESEASEYASAARSGAAEVSERGERVRVSAASQVACASSRPSRRFLGQPSPSDVFRRTLACIRAAALST